MLVDTFDVVLCLMAGLPVGVAGDCLLAELGRAAKPGALQALVAREAVAHPGG